MKKILISITTISSFIIAGAYKVPEQSLNSMALGASYVAHTEGADTAYFNPANMVFLDSDKQMIDTGLTLAHLPKYRFRGYQAFGEDEVYSANGNSKVENITISYFHYISNLFDNLRWGASVTVPGGLSKRWDSDYQKLFAEEFTLKVIEFNPVIAYKISDNFSIGGGVRAIYSEGKVYSDGSQVGKPIKREMEGDTIEYGYNLATTYKPTKDINLALTYRSNVDLKESGEANLYIGDIGKQYNADVTVPLPASLNFAISKTWMDRFTLEFDYERTYWSKYKNLDFNYGSPIQPTLVEPFDNPIPKHWKDTDTFRIGATMKVDNITYMMGYAIDETPIPKKYLSYELPDSDGQIFSMGFRVKANENLSWGVAYLHDKKDTITLKEGENRNGIIGKFSGGGADLLTAGISYEF
jgi:long-chain fatty acid transport protein